MRKKLNNKNKDFSKKLSGQMGESLVVAELGRRKIIATAFAGNVPDIDLLAYKNGKSIPLQVKALKSGSLRNKANKYLEIEFKGKQQVIKGKNKNINRKLIFVIVKIGKSLEEDIFYICDQGKIQDIVYKSYKYYLYEEKDKNKKTKNGIRPKNYKSFDCSVTFEDIEKYKNNWDLIEKSFL